MLFKNRELRVKMVKPIEDENITIDPEQIQTIVAETAETLASVVIKTYATITIIKTVRDLILITAQSGK